MVIAAAGSAVAFLLNAASFFGVIFFLYRWKRPHFEQVEKGRMWDALRAGIRYMRGDALVRCILIRTGAFSLAASSLLALLPLLARPYGASGFGLLLGSFGLGALSGAALLPRLRSRFSVDGVVALAILLFAAMTFASGQRTEFRLALSHLICQRHWLDRNSCMPQHCGPDHVAVVATGTRAFHVPVGAAGWNGIGQRCLGRVSTKVGVPNALLASSIALVLGLFTVRRYRLTARDLQLAPAVVRD